MSAPLSHTAKLKVMVPVGFLLASFMFYVTTAFLIELGIYHVIGALVTFISSILWIIARVQLGDAPTDGRFVTTGLYNEVRHPIYYFSTMAFMGYAIFIRVPELWLFAAAFVAFQIVRIRAEEKRLLIKFGRRYERYKRRTLL